MVKKGPEWREKILKPFGETDRQPTTQEKQTEAEPDLSGGDVAPRKRGS